MGKNTVAIVLELRGHQLAAAIAALAKEGYRSFKRERAVRCEWKVEGRKQCGERRRRQPLPAYHFASSPRLSRIVYCYSSSRAGKYRAEKMTNERRTTCPGSLTRIYPLPRVPSNVISPPLVHGGANQAMIWARRWSICFGGGVTKSSNNTPRF